MNPIAPPMSAIYIAAPGPMVHEARALRSLLQASGLAVTSRWLDAIFEDTHEAAQMDLDDVRQADTLIALNPPSWALKGTGGRHVELGYALALGKRVLLFGARTNVFHYQAGVQFVPMSTGLLQAFCFQGDPRG